MLETVVTNVCSGESVTGKNTGNVSVNSRQDPILPAGTPKSSIPDSRDQCGQEGAILGAMAHNELKILQGSMAYADKIAPGVAGRVTFADGVALVTGVLRTISNLAVEGRPIFDTSVPMPDIKVGPVKSMISTYAEVAASVTKTFVELQKSSSSSSGSKAAQTKTGGALAPSISQKGKGRKRSAHLVKGKETTTKVPLGVPKNGPKKKNSKGASRKPSGCFGVGDDLDTFLDAFNESSSHASAANRISSKKKAKPGSEKTVVPTDPSAILAEKQKQAASPKLTSAMRACGRAFKSSEWKEVIHKVYDITDFNQIRAHLEKIDLDKIDLSTSVVPLIRYKVVTYSDILSYEERRVNNKDTTDRMISSTNYTYKRLVQKAKGQISGKGKSESLKTTNKPIHASISAQSLKQAKSSLTKTIVSGWYFRGRSGMIVPEYISKVKNTFLSSKAMRLRLRVDGKEGILPTYPAMRTKLLSLFRNVIPDVAGPVSDQVNYDLTDKPFKGFVPVTVTYFVDSETENPIKYIFKTLMGFDHVSYQNGSHNIFVYYASFDHGTTDFEAFYDRMVDLTNTKVISNNQTLDGFFIPESRDVTFEAVSGEAIMATPSEETQTEECVKPDNCNVAQSSVENESSPRVGEVQKSQGIG